MSKEIFEQIYSLLDEYFEMSDSMVTKGFPWAVIISLHEVYRHLYPTEPYIETYSVKDSEKPKYLLELLEKQRRYYSGIMGSVLPYKALSPENLRDVYESDEDTSTETATSTLYGNLWDKFVLDNVLEESKKLLNRRINSHRFGLIELAGKTVLDLGCGSGRYTIALSTYDSRNTIGFDIGGKGIEIGEEIVKTHGIRNVKFIRGNVLDLPFEDETFDFVFCNGVLHHTKNMEMGLSELYRVVRTGGTAFLYLYADYGLFWNFRKRARRITSRIPSGYAQQVLNVIGLPSNRFIFMDTWYVPIERHISKDELENILLNGTGFSSIEKLVSTNETDLDFQRASDNPNARELYGDGEHRYLLFK